MLRKLVLPAVVVAAARLCAADPPPVTAADGRSFQVESVARPGQLVRPEDANARDGTPIILYPRQAWKCMTWKLTAVADGSDQFRLVNHFTHKTLAAGDAGDAVVERSAKGEPPAWHLAKLDDGTYRIEQAGRALTAGADGHLTVAPYTGAVNQRWRLLAKPDHFTG